MNMTFRLKAYVLMLAVAFTVSCTGDSPTAPLDIARQASHTVQDVTGRTFTIIEGMLPEKREASAWIDRNGGYVLLRAGTRANGQSDWYGLYIPEHTVNRPTLFTIRLANHVHLSFNLTAMQRQKNGGVVNVGKAGFKQPVYLFLTYAHATNVTDPSKLVILYDPEDGRPNERVKSAPQLTDQYVIAELAHFSRYAMGAM